MWFAELDGSISFLPMIPADLILFDVKTLHISVSVEIDNLGVITEARLQCQSFDCFNSVFTRRINADHLYVFLVLGENVEMLH